MMKIKCLIIDDEPLAINVISNYLDQMNDFVLADRVSLTQEYPLHTQVIKELTRS